jgi:hypothetical protein
MTIGMYVDPERLASVVAARLSHADVEVSAYWIQVIGDREDYAQKLRDALSGCPVGVFIVRDVAFDNPNSILVDLINILNRNRMTCEELLSKAEGSSRFGAVLLSRTLLSVSQASSPATLPDWFPICGGQTVSIVIEDLTWTADAPLNSQEAKIDEICERLYECEGALLRRLRAAHISDHNCGNALMEVIRRSETERYDSVLTEFDHYHTGIRVPSAFRPSLREGKSLISRLWGIVQVTTCESLHRPSKALATALALHDQIESDWQESFISVLHRPSNRDKVPSHRFARNLLMSVASSCQLITATAHADAYARYPIPLLISFSYDLRCALLDSERILAL